MRRYRRARTSGREQAIEEQFDTEGMEAEPLPQGPDDDFSLRPFAEGDAYRDELPDGAVTEDGPDIDTLLRRARRSAGSGRYRDGVQAYLDVLEVAQDHLQARRELARLLESGEDAEGALRHLDRAIELAPGRPDILTERGALKARFKYYTAAIADLDDALKLEPSYAPAHFERGLVQLRRGRAQEAAGEFRRALEIQDDLTGARYYLGESLNLLGQYDSAITVLEVAIDREPADARAYQLLGRVMDRCGRPEEAMTMYQKAREVAGR
jgi:tetratricopeptide (TPR) repeat protein